MRSTLLVALATFAVAVHADLASAAFDSCTYDGGARSVTATFGAGTSATLARGAAGAIEADGVQCGATATVTNTDLIVVNGDAQAETLTLRLDGPDGGQFAPGFTDEIDFSDEIEMQVHLGTGSPQVITILGSAAADFVKIGIVGGAQFWNVNLNADPFFVDADSDMVVDRSGGNPTFVVNGGGGNDVLSDAGAPGAANTAQSGVLLDGEAGNDDITVTAKAVAGPGNDTFRFPSTDGFGFLSYAAAPGPVTITLTSDAGGATSAGGDGWGDTDTFDREIGPLTLSPFADHATAQGNASFNLPDAGAGDDVIDGGSGTDSLSGRGGNDTLRGGGGFDLLIGGDGNDDLQGGAGGDQLQGDAGADSFDGGDGDDLITETQAIVSPDDFHGGAGRDLLQYSSFRCPTSNANGSVYGFLRTAGVTVDLDDVADDGAPGEGDNVHTDIEDLQGTSHDDTLIGDDDANLLRGFGGHDTLRGGAGDDRVEGMREVCSPAYGEDFDAQIGDTGDDLDGGPGADIVNGRLGDDVIATRDSVADTIDCGAGTADVLTGDLMDVFSNCETADLGTEPSPPPPSTTPDTTPAPPPPPTVTTVTTPTATPTATPRPLPLITALVDRPATKKCVSRRRLRLRVKRSVVGQVRSVTVFVNGKRKTVVKGSKLALPVDLRGLPKGRFSVRLSIVLTDGRTVGDTRRYRTCAAKKKR